MRFDGQKQGKSQENIEIGKVFCSQEIGSFQGSFATLLP
jgi:hypothetical protein